jgi:glycogen debranching enzyme GlgX
MQRYAAQKEGNAKDQFIKMVKAFHRAGIKVFIDVVYNHTGEAFDLLIWDSFCGIDRETYYMVKEEIDENFTGCGNTLNVGNPVVKDLVMDSLRYFAKEMGIDGFRFDLASILNRDQKGNLLDPSPLVLEIANDPILKDKILIAEPWDAAMAYQVGHFAKANSHWLEWNGSYRDCMRMFVRGDPGSKNKMATSFCGSQPTFSTSRPQNSVNFITAHDGYSLRDLVSYERKHNEANLEKNHDGNNENLSWNGGVEGETSDPGILGLRRRQMKNYFTLLLLSQGIPMLLMGDEYGHTRKGNNNPYPQDNRINWFQWDELEKNEGLFHFLQSLIHFRKEHPLLKKTKFVEEKEIVWHGTHPTQPSWNNPEPFLGCTLIDPQDSHLLFYSNATKGAVEAMLPNPPTGKSWHLIVDTFAESPHDFYPKGSEKEIRSLSYTFSSYSSALFKALS